MQAALVYTTALPPWMRMRTRPTSDRPTPMPAFFMAQATPASGRASHRSLTASRVSLRAVPGSATWPLGSTSPGSTAFWKRICQGLRPVSRARRLMHDSMAKQDWVTPNPRKAPPGGLLV